MHFNLFVKKMSSTIFASLVSITSFGAVAPVFAATPGYSAPHTATLKVNDAHGEAEWSDYKYYDSTVDFESGDEVDIDVNPDKGYVTQMTVTDAKGNEIETESLEAGQKDFIMPESDVTINVSFKKPSAHSVTLTQPEHGKLSFGDGNGSFLEEDTVPIIVKPDEGFKILSVTATDAEGKKLSIYGSHDYLEDDDNEEDPYAYCFDMPASAVKVQAVIGTDSEFEDLKNSRDYVSAYDGTEDEDYAIDYSNDGLDDYEMDNDVDDYGYEPGSDDDDDDVVEDETEDNVADDDDGEDVIEDLEKEKKASDKSDNILFSLGLKGGVGTSVSKSRKSIYYGGWSTHKYKIKTTAGNHYTAYCATPKKKSVSGTLTVHNLKKEKVQFVLMFGENGPWSSKAMTYFNLGNKSKKYAWIHAAVAYFYCGSTKGLTSKQVNKIKSGYKAAWAKYGDKFKEIKDSYVFYYGVPKNSKQQIVAWLKHQPDEKYIYAYIQKKSTLPEVSKDNKNYSMEGIKYGIYDNLDSAKKKADDSHLIEVMELNKNGKSGLIPSWKYKTGAKLYATELSVPKDSNYNISDEVISLMQDECKTVTSLTKSQHKHTMVLRTSKGDTPKTTPLELTLKKVDSATGTSKPNGDASLEGAQFTVKFYDTKEKIKSEKELDGIEPTRKWVMEAKYDQSSDSYIITFDNDHKVSGDKLYTDAKGNIILPYGYMTLEETKQPENGYVSAGKLSVTDKSGTKQLDSKVYFAKIDCEDVFKDITITAPDKVMYGGFKIEKHDKELKTNAALGGASLKDTEFTLKNKSDNAVYVDTDDDGKYEKYEPDAVIMTVKTNAKGQYSSRNDLLPYGKYSLQETKSPDGYFLSDGKEHEFDVKKDGEIVNVGAVEDQVKRGDIKFTKVSQSGGQTKYAPGVQFKITNLESGESHIVATDDYGKYESSSNYVEHSHNTNSGKALSGTWFGLANDGSGKEAPVDDKLGALPYGTYRIQEIEGEANKGMIMYDNTITIDRDVTELPNSYNGVIDFNSIINQPVTQPTIGTQAKNDETDDHYAAADKHITIVDTVSCNYLEVGEKYTLIGTLMDKETGKAITDNNGNAITSTVTFTAYMENGTQDVEFTIDATDLVGKDTVVFEELYDSKGDFKAFHKDINDEGQTIHFTEAKTKAVDANTDTNITKASEDVTIIDTVEYKNLKPDKKYTVTGTLMDKETGKEALDDDGKVITASTIFTPEKPDGTVEVEFKFSGVHTAGKTLVAFEEVTYKDRVYAVHADINDEDQTIYFPEIGTTAVSDETGTKTAPVAEKVTITDTVTYKNLIPGKEYTMKGTLMDKETGDALLVNGEEVTASKTFTPEDADGTVEMKFTLDSSALAGKTSVVFEDLYLGDKEVAVHADIEDEGQTVEFPEIKTKAEDDKSGTQNSLAEEEITITDTISYKGLTPGEEYTVSGTLMDKETGEPILVDEKEVTSSTTFTPEASEGTVEVKFTFNGTGLAGKTLVAFENLSYKDIELMVHADINDEDQTVYVPEIHTNAADEKTGMHNGFAGEKAVIIDTVSYKGLQPGQEYTVNGTLMDKETGKPVQDNGKDVIATATFTPEKSEGTVDVRFEFDASALSGKTTVVFEKILIGEAVIATHEDIEDEEQSVIYPEVRTRALDEKTKSHNALAEKETTIIDTVCLKGLIAGEEYTVSGVLMDKATGKELSVDGKPVTASATFTAEAAEQNVEIKFTFDGSKLAGNDYVAFETLSYKDTVIGEHKDIEDMEQTVSLPKIGTKATDKADGDHTIEAGKSTIVDKVAYSNLTAGEKYKVEGILMDKATGKEVKVNGKAVTASTEFTPETSTGETEVTFTFDASNLGGKDLVVFETLYKEITDEETGKTDDKEVANHKDIEDEAQTVTVKKPSKSDKGSKIPSTPDGSGSGNGNSGSGTGSSSNGSKTGDNLMMYIGGFAASVAALLGIIFVYRKKVRA